MLRILSFFHSVFCVLHSVMPENREQAFVANCTLSGNYNFAPRRNSRPKKARHCRRNWQLAISQCFKRPDQPARLLQVQLPHTNFPPTRLRAKWFPFKDQESWTSTRPLLHSWCEAVELDSWQLRMEKVCLHSSCPWLPLIAELAAAKISQAIEKSAVEV